MVAEYVADYNEGHLSRRDLIRRVLNITGGSGRRDDLAGDRLHASQPAPSRHRTSGAAQADHAPLQPAAVARRRRALPVGRGRGQAGRIAVAGAAPAASPAALARPRHRQLRRLRKARCRCRPTTRASTGRTYVRWQGRRDDHGLPGAAEECHGATALVLVCHENRGLTEHIRDVARRFAKEGYIAVAVDLVSR